MSKIVQHEIKDNLLIIDNKEYFPLGLSKIITGVENENRQEILKDEETGLNYSRNAVEGQEIFNLKNQKHHPWFILDLETGKRGWYPGCEIHGDVLGENINIYEAPNSDSNIIKSISEATVKILNLEDINAEPFDAGWYQIKYDAKKKIKKEYVTNLRYEDPFK